MAEGKTWTDRLIGVAPHLAGALVGGLLYIVTIRSALDALRDDFNANKAETRALLAEIRTDTKGLPALLERVTQLEIGRRDQQGFNGATDGRLVLLERRSDVLGSDVSDLKTASRQVLHK